MRAIKDHAGDMMPSIILPDLDMTVSRALKYIVGYCNKHTRCQDGCRLWDDDGPRCLLRTDAPPRDWEAIETLKGADGDLISRQAALKPFCIAPDGTRIPEVDCDNFPVEFSVEFIKKHLLSLPSVEPKTGEWKSTTSGDHYKCSVCGYRAGYWFNEENSCEYSLDMSEWLSDFCPNCGARMNGEDGEA